MTAATVASDMCVTIGCVEGIDVMQDSVEVRDDDPFRVLHFDDGSRIQECLESGRFREVPSGVRHQSRTLGGGFDEEGVAGNERARVTAAKMDCREGEIDVVRELMLDLALDVDESSLGRLVVAVEERPEVELAPTAVVGSQKGRTDRSELADLEGKLGVDGIPRPHGWHSLTPDQPSR